MNPDKGQLESVMMDTVGHESKGSSSNANEGELHPAETMDNSAQTLPPDHGEPSLQEIQVLKQDLKKSKNDLEIKNARLKDVTKRWKLAARELDELRSQNQGFYQVTDDYLIGLASQLRFSIKSFAIQYFGEEIPPEIHYLKTEFWKKYMEITLAPDEFIMSSQRRPGVIQAFIWRCLVGQVFNRFRWANDLAISLRELYNVLQPSRKSEKIDHSHRDAALERRFQVWVATTAGMILEVADPPDQAKIAQKFGNTLVEKMRDTLEPFLSGHDRNYEENLLRIIYDAVMLDRELCRQVSRIEWVFLETQATFDAATMTLEKDLQHSEPSWDLKVVMVVAPAMTKRGKSTGEDFHVESLLIPLEVFAE